MATVTDLSGNSPLDKSFCKYNRSNAGNPNASLTPQYTGEIVLDTTNNDYWVAKGTANNTWVLLSPDLGA